MPWGEKTVERSREEFVTEVLSGEKSMSQLCREYGISRPTGYKWLQRFQEGEEMTDRSRAPFYSPNKIGSELLSKILEERSRHPYWGPRKLKRVLENQGIQAPAASTICRKLKDNGCVAEEASRNAAPNRRFQREQPNELWQTDFKGDFALLDGTRCHPLTVLDDCSRFSLCIDAKSSQQKTGVMESFERLFKEYGKPLALLCDNGNPWGTKHLMGYSDFELWLMDHDILPIHGRFRHPQTQGKEERFHRTMIDELLKHVELRDLSQAQEYMDRFRREYNNDRPHHALGLDVPASRYYPSSRRWEAEPESWAYPEDYDIWKVSTGGDFTYQKKRYRLSATLSKRWIGMRQASVPGVIYIYYRQFKIASFDTAKGELMDTKIFRCDGPKL